MIKTIFPATAMPDADWWQALWPKPLDVVARLGVRARDDAVDLCCGTGLFTVPLAMIARRVFAIDLDPQLLELARVAAARAGIRNCEFIEGDAHDVAALVPQPVDFVLIANTFHGVPDKARLANSIASMLAPGGRLAIVNWHRRPREETVVLGRPRGPRSDLRMRPEDVVAVVEPAGLDLIDTVELPPYHYATVFAKR